MASGEIDTFIIYQLIKINLFDQNIKLCLFHMLHLVRVTLQRYNLITINDSSRPQSKFNIKSYHRRRIVLA